MGSLTLRPADSLTIPRMALSIGFKRSGSLSSCDPSYRVLTLTLVGLPPTERVHLLLTHCHPFRTPYLSGLEIDHLLVHRIISSSSFLVSL
jgi:hypothetical protein